MKDVTMFDAYEMIRVINKWSMQEMADILGITKQAYSLYNTGKQTIPKWMDIDGMKNRIDLMQNALKVYTKFNKD